MREVGAILKAIEFSCHNVLWIGVTLIGFYVSPDATFFRHLLVGIVSDIVHVAIIKAYSRRRRPSYGANGSKDADERSKDADKRSKDGAKASEDAESKDGAQSLINVIDKHSFPSGHASRAIYLASLISNHYLGWRHLIFNATIFPHLRMGSISVSVQSNQWKKSPLRRSFWRLVREG